MRATNEAEVRVVLSTGAAVVGLLVCLGSIGVVALSASLGPSVAAFGRSWLDSALFVVGATTAVTGIVVDNAAIGLRRGFAQLVRNGVMAAARLAFVVGAVLVGGRSATALLGAWVASNSLSLAVAPRLLRLPAPTRGPGRVARRIAVVRRYGGLALRHHGLNLAITSVTFFLPFVAALLVSSRKLAFFSAAQLIASAVLLPPALLAMSLFAESAGDDAALRHHIRRTLPIAIGCCLGIIGILEPLAPVALRLFGTAYMHNGTPLLRLLLLGGIPYIAKDHYVAIRRAQGRLSEAAVRVLAGTALEVAGAAIGASFAGVEGLCAGWVLATTAESIGYIPVVASVVRTRGEHHQ
jgi:O-antigen/teichoic acid export membrane protein